MAVPPRLAPLLAQFDFALGQLVGRLEGLSDAEYLWEPVPGCWSIRPAAGSQMTSGTVAEQWVMDAGHPVPDPPPFTTLAYRLCHVARGLALRADYTIGSKCLTQADLPVPRTAAGGITYLVENGAAWRRALDPTTDADLDWVGRSSFPWGLDPTLPFLDICWWVNQEVLHHGAEIALLRDLYRAQG